MSMRSARRLFAGLAAAGAFVAATAWPAHAAPNIEIHVSDTLVAPDHSAHSFFFASAPELEPVGRASIVIDSTDLRGIATIRVMPFSEWDCDAETGEVISCTVLDAESGLPGSSYFVDGASGAALGATGTIEFTVEVDGVKATASSRVTIAEASDLATDALVEVEGDPGSVAGANLPVRNIGQTTVARTVLNVTPDWRTPYQGDYSNCTNYQDAFVLCEFDQEIAPGSVYRLSEDIPFAIDSSARTGAVIHAYAMWLTEDDWDVIKKTWLEGVIEGEPGTGEPLRLEAVSAARVPQTDIDTNNNYSAIDIHVRGDNPADVAAVGATASGAKGETVTVSPGVKNLGPAYLEMLANEPIPPVLRITIPEGTTVTDVGYNCAPYVEGGTWPDYEAFGQPGADEYGCLLFEANPGDTVGYDFTLRIDEVVADATGTVTVKLNEDPNPANDVAKIVINGTGPGGGEGGGGEGGGLPVTGPQSALVAVVGVLLLGAGVAGFLIARRRRTRFVA